MNVQKTSVLLLALCALISVLAPARAQQGPRIRTLSEQEVTDLMVGAAIQGTRSSDTTVMIRQAKALLAAGKRFNIVSVDELPDDWTIVTAAGGIGGGGAWPYVTERINQQNVPSVSNPTEIALRALSQHLGKTFNAVIRNEAAEATLNAFEVATAVDLPVVDACPAGRAKPEVEESLPFINGISVTPAALVTRWGDTIFLDKTVDDYRYEDIARAIAVGSGGGVSNARGVLSGRDVKRVTIHGALSEAILFGRTVREAAAQGKDPIDALLKVSGAHKMFAGVVSRADEKGARGFTWWDIELQGSGAYSGHTYRIWVKNENILSWLDSKPDVMSPDLIYNLDPKTAEAISSSGLGGYSMGTEVVIVARPAPSPAWRTPKGIEVIGPRHFGFDFDYQSLEQILKTRPKFGSHQPT